MPFCLVNSKKSVFNPPSDKLFFVDVRNLSRKENLAYKIVENLFRNHLSSPILMMITEKGGSGKSFVINALRQLLHIYCIVSLYYGIFTFNINGITLHSLLKLTM